MVGRTRMSFCLFIVILLSCCCYNCIGFSFCPATSLVLNSGNTSFIRRHAYPLIFYPTPSTNTSAPKRYISNEGNEERNCTLHSLPDLPQICLASNHKNLQHCPVSLEQVKAADSAQTWPTRDQSFCRLASEVKKSMYNSKETSNTPVYEMNIVILGGSMPHGSDLNGYCCCFQETDSRCPSSNLESPRGEKASTICKQDEFCSWVTLFTDWLRLQFPSVKFNIHRQTTSGISSGIAPSVLGRFYRSINLTSNDIFLIDYSVNDCYRMPLSCPGPDLLTFEIERMYRHLFHSIGIFPTVIVLEQYPHGSPYSYSSRIPTTYEKRINKECDYSNTYRTLAKHYNLMYWSSREAYWTNLNYELEESKRYPISVYELIHITNHAPWYTHSYLADLYASLFLHHLEKCSPKNQFVSNILPSSYLNESLFFHEKFCQFGLKLLVEYRPWRRDVPGTLTGPDALANGWREYADHRDIPGYIITNYSSPSKWTLSFPFEGADVSWPKSYVGMILVTRYLQSYENMGRVEIGICGRRTGVILDGLDRQHHVSIPHTFIYDITDEDSQHCLTLPLSERTIDYIYLGPPQSSSAPPPTDTQTRFRSRHQRHYRRRHLRETAEDQEEEEIIRGIQKFKILAIDFCFKDGSPFRRTRRHS